MDQHERQHKQSQQFDIFDSSPQRPFANAHLNDSLDQLVLPNGDINFSRKREQSPRQGEDEHEHGPKRHRSENWPLQENASGGNESRQKPSTCHHLTSPSKRRGTPVRPSKFVEASMHDRPSGTPPSMFVRNLNVHITNASVDHLMEDYDQLQSKPLPPRPSSRASRSRSPIKRRQQSSEFTHHANQSISSNGLLSAPSTIADEQKQSGGFFRFGKSMASAFNPVNVWQKVSNNWRETKEELIQEAIVKKELDERKIKAAETYNTLKKSGKLEKQGSRPLSEIFTPGYTKPSEEPNQRDSGIALDFDDRSSVDTGGRPRSMAPPGGESLRKSPFHFRTPSMNNFKDPAAVDDDETPRKSFRHLRTPSLHDLKRIASEVSLHKRSVSTSISRSPEKEGTPGMNDLRRSISKKDLLKQDKLSRRVSDLEAKLEAARCELQSALKDPPATETADDTPRASRSRSGPRPRTSMGTWKRAFTPGLPTLLSERLLGGESAEERERESMEENEMFTSAINETQERPKTRNFSGDSLYTLPNEPLATNLGFIPLNVSLLDSIEIKEKGAEVGDTAHPSTQVPEVIELPHKLPELPFIATQTEPAALARSLTRKPVAKKKRASLEDRVYRPNA
ncbi:hypothetical protein EJ08DRAFT_136785 [Tothia fuscella]|uniref:Nuclear RNA binding protein n=1 Tax=Tothia fuscella TaxID=1048955 RepID=A0A9P4NUZ9_9PEZI|nr:hypothetical protein EJ08DRAFT_136785 [Tothia fuscella]